MRALLETGLTNAVLATILAVAVAFLAGLLRRRPAIVHALWLLVLLKLLTPGLVSLAISLPESELPSDKETSTFAAAAPEEELAMPEAFPVIDEAGTPSVLLEAVDPGPAFAWWQTTTACWLTGSVVWFAWWGWQTYRFQRWLSYATPAPAELQAVTAGLARRLGLARCPKVWLMSGAVAPMVWPVGRAPRIVFPARLLKSLSAAGRDALLLHELAHVRRRDHWIRLIELAAVGLYWWHPVVWWARRRLHDAEEQCCDAWVVAALGGEGRPYAQALIETVSFFSNARTALPVTASGIGQVPHLRRRLTMIMQGTTPKSLSWAGALAVLVLAAASLAPTARIRAEDPAAPAKDADLKERQKKLQEELEKVQAEIKKREAAAEKNSIKARVTVSPGENVLDVQKKIEAAPAGARVELRVEDGKAKIVAAPAGAHVELRARAVTPEVKAAQEQLKKAITDLRQAEEKLRAALERQGGVADWIQGYKLYPNNMNTIANPPAGVWVDYLNATNPSDSVWLYSNKINRANPKPTAKPPAAESSQERRIKDLEKKLDDLQKAVEKLRR